MSTIKLSVVVCSRDRVDDLSACVASILASPNAEFELIVIDQSRGEGAARALDVHSGDARLRYFGTQTRGLSRARNEALERATGPIIVFTDDDCRVESDWVDRVVVFFEARPDVALAFGTVSAPEEIQRKGHVATFEPSELTFRGRFPSPMTTWGIGANMALRREAFVRAGPFDAELGAGSSIPAGEELDFTIRVLGSGLSMANTAAFAVTHLGVREHEAARALYLGYITGAGAAYAKNIRLGTGGAKRLFFRWFAGSSAGVVRALVEWRRPLGVGIVVAGLRGGFAAFRRPLDARTRSLRPLTR
jgi:glycosyltransferase involved in cell wall biosynthesis